MSTRTGIAMVLMLCFLLSSTVVKAQRNAPPVKKDSVFSIIEPLDPSKMSQTRKFVVPEGVTYVKIQCWGAGAAGAYMNPPGLFHDPRAGVGGGGGAYARIDSLPVTPGQVLTVVIGQGGYGSSDVHGNGGDSYVQYGGVTKVLAKGAATVASDERTNGGIGGQASECQGDFKFSGGNGGLGEKGPWAGSGAGGGVAGTSGNGYNGGNGTVGDISASGSKGGNPGEGYPFLAPNTGKGADGVVSHTGGRNGKNAVNYGGGGGGAATALLDNAFGGDGGDGVVVITYNECQAYAGQIDTMRSECAMVIINSTAASGTDGSYFWEKSADGLSNWTLIQGANLKEYTPTEAAWYHRGYMTVCGNSVYTDSVYVQPLGTPAPGYVSIAGSPELQTWRACYETEVKINLAAVATEATTLLTWQSSEDGGANWTGLSTKEPTLTQEVSIPSITKDMKYRYYFEPVSGCKVYSSNEFTVSVDTGVIGRPDFYFDDDTVNIMMRYGERDTMPYIYSPVYYPQLGVTLSNNKSAENEGYLLGRVDTGAYIIEWTVSDCGKTKTKTYNKVYMVMYPKCGEDYTIIDADSNVYNTVRIGTECWTRENLRTLHYNTGDTIKDSRIYVSPQHSDTLANLATYGRLYTWNTAAAITPLLQVPVKNIFGHVEGICPEGWVLPTDQQYRDLYAYDSRELRSTNLWLDGAGTNLTGMTLLPGGCYNAVSGRCEDLLGYAYFWSDMESIGEKSFSFWVDCHCYQLQKTEYNKNNGMSVRCVKEKTAYVPEVHTMDVTGITSDGATFNAIVTDDGALEVLDRGFCYGTTEMPTMENGTVVHAATTGTGAYSVSVSGLTESVYYVRAYAVNAKGLAYGEQETFTTVVIYTDTITFMPNGAMGGTMSQQVVTRGVATALNANKFTHSANEAPDTNWAFIGWNTDALGRGTSYADGANITTNGNDTLHAQWHTWCNGTARTGESGTGRVDSVQDIDGNSYKVVQIGTQCWLKENLKTTRYANGDYISKGAFIDSTTAYRYFPNDDTNNVAVYGHLYNWPAVMHNSSSSSSNPSGVQGVCPNGWHVPSDAELTQLTDYVGSQDAYRCNNTSGYNAKALSSTTGWVYLTSAELCAVCLDSNSNNATGFTGVPAGYYYPSIAFFGKGAYLWSSTESTVSKGKFYARNWTRGATSLASSSFYKSYGYSVRCVRDVVVNDTITFMPNGAMGGTMSQQVVTRGVATALSANQFTHGPLDAPDTNWAFMGWNTHALGYGTSYADGANITTNGNDTLHAQWHTWCNGTAITGESGSTGRVDSVKDVDNNWYKVVQIGNQCWLKENLKTTKYADGTPISSTSPSTETSQTTAYWYYPNNSSSNKEEYGLLYNWPAVMNGSLSSTANPSSVQGVCPNGWHVPSYAEWTQLTDSVSSKSKYVCAGGDQIAKALAFTTGWDEYEDEDCAVGNEQSSNNATGFSAVPAGGSYVDAFVFGQFANFWSATQEGGDIESNAYYSFLFYEVADVQNNVTYGPESGFSVRCVRDKEVAVKDTITFMPNGATGGTMEKQVVTRGTATALSANQFTHTSPDANWAFEGWNTDALGNGTSYAAGANITTNGNDTLHAQWHTWCNGTARTGEMGTGRVDSVKDKDNNWYKVVQIGNQCWMKENLKTTRYADSTLIVNYNYPNGSASNKEVYGLLYDFPTIMNGSSSSTANPSGVQGVCPDGWHLPSDTEFTQLTNYVNSNSGYKCNSTSNNIAKALASTTGWISSEEVCAVGNNPSVNNAAGFTAVSAGYYYNGGLDFGYGAYFWSATLRDDERAYYRYWYRYFATVNKDDFFIENGYSVRCVRNSQAPE